MDDLDSKSLELFNDIVSGSESHEETVELIIDTIIDLDDTDPSLARGLVGVMVKILMGSLMQLAEYLPMETEEDEVEEERVVN